MTSIHFCQQLLVCSPERRAVQSQRLTSRQIPVATCDTNYHLCRTTTGGRLHTQKQGAKRAAKVRKPPGEGTEGKAGALSKGNMFPLRRKCKEK